jgi:hypothetical protein
VGRTGSRNDRRTTKDIEIWKSGATARALGA